MFNLKNQASIFFKKMLDKCHTSFNKETIVAKISNNKRKVVAACVIATFAVGSTAIAANYRVGYTVKVENVVLGVVATKGEYYEVLDEVKKEVDTISEIEFSPVTDESFNMEIVPVDSFTEKEELAENVKSVSDGMVEACVITANGEFLAALHTEDDANRLKDDYLKNFYDEKYELVDYAAEVLVTSTHTPEDTVKTYDEAYEEFMQGEVVLHTVEETDTKESIAEKYNVLAEDILKNNEIEEVTIGQTLKIYTNKPIIPIKTVTYINENIEIPFETEKVEDDTVYRGQTRIKTEGKSGEKYLHAYITEVDGVVTIKNIIEEVILSEPVTQIELVGTKEPPPEMGTGDFIMPASGRLTSPFGARWGRNHNGIDIAAKIGTPIYASDNGIVIESEYRNNGYGNIIKIDHQNGFISYYAHCSELYANVGDVVAKGDLIAAIGNTGRSTGPHLHFEIRQNNIAKDPYNFIK